MTDKLRQAIEQTVAILGPEAPLCSGCVEEWTEALRILRAALAQQPAEPQDPVAYNGWVLREVLFDNGEPVGHREPTKAEPQEPVAWMVTDIAGRRFLFRLEKPVVYEGETLIPLYPAPQPAKREPLPPASPCALTEAEYRIFKLGWLECEAAHGIGEQE